MEGDGNGIRMGHLLPSAEGEGLGHGGAFLLKEQCTQVTDQAGRS